jgi:hypothetical protein
MSAKPASRELIRKLAIEWPKVEAGLGAIDISAYEQIRRTPREKARLAHASEILQRPVATFNDLSMAEGLKLLSVYKEATGEEFKPLAVGYGGVRRWSRKRPASMIVDGSILWRIGEIASALFPGNWSEALGARCMERFRNPDPRALTPSQARSLVEELLQRLAVRKIRESRSQESGVRSRFRGRRSRRRRSGCGGSSFRCQVPGVRCQWRPSRRESSNAHIAEIPDYSP